jgi:hypothetical protein
MPVLENPQFHDALRAIAADPRLSYIREQAADFLKLNLGTVPPCDLSGLERTNQGELKGETNGRVGDTERGLDDSERSVAYWEAEKQAWHAYQLEE